MIPKKIHYCWFGNAPYPKTVEQCIKSWKLKLPDYEIIRWDETNIDLHQNTFIQQAYQYKKYAFVSDYVRLDILHHYGGIYLDTDVEILKSLDRFLNNTFFTGIETIRFKSGKTKDIGINTGIMGTVAYHPFIKRCIEYYQTQSFILPGGNLNMKLNTKIIPEIMTDYGYQYKDELQYLDNITIYPTTVFPNITHPYSEDAYALHRFMNSWRDNSHRGIIFRIAQKYNLLSFYHFIEKCRGKKLDEINQGWKNK